MKRALKRAVVLRFGVGANFGMLAGMTQRLLIRLALLTALTAAVAPASTPAPVPARDPDAFAIEIVDDQTGRGVPLVELETVNNLRLYTDSAGVAAFREPWMMNQTVFFYVRSHGYEFEKDWIGFAGRQVEVTPGGSVKWSIKRINVAERLYRVTGGGIYADSLLLGRTAPIEHPLINSGVLGLDSVQAAVYRGKIYWFWGDTNRLSYPLGSFGTTGATSDLPGQGGLDPSIGVNLRYFANDEGFVRPMLTRPEKGPLWTDAVCVVPDAQGRERLVGNFIRVKTLGENLERGIVVWDDDKQAFEKQVDIPLDHPLGPQGQAVTRRVVHDGVAYQYFAHWGPANIRVPATLERFLDLSAYEGYTPLAPGARFDGPNTRLERDASGKLVWGWKRDTPPLENRQKQKLAELGLMKPEESPQVPVDVETGKPVVLHSASIQWNEYRKRWVMIALEFDGTSKLGEVWYGEADAPEGPWSKVRKVVTHHKYSFYNPRHHAFFDGDGGRYLYFEGTFANSISGTDVATPKYDYNQVMYRLDLDDPRLAAVRAATTVPESPAR